jgi:hypothetical protein
MQAMDDGELFVIRMDAAREFLRLFARPKA